MPAARTGSHERSDGPELVVYDENGQPQTVRYHFLNALLLNEVQRQARRAEAQQREIAA